LPPLTQPQIVGWLLLFVPGFVALSVMSWLGWPATRRSQLHWLAYALLISLGCELLLRWSLDHVLPGWADPVSHPVRRALALLAVAFVFGCAIGLLQAHWRFNRWVWWLLRESAMPTVWLAYFRNPSTAEYVRVETTNGMTMVAHVDSYSVDPGDPNQELILTDVAVKVGSGWDTLPGPVYLSARQVAMVVSGHDPEALRSALPPADSRAVVVAAP
jgi:hypothetical protein